jgi:hypothetical protein
MAEDCCTTMSVLSRTRAEIERALRLDPLASDPNWEPLVRWDEGIGLNVIASTAIFFCPWCGRQLPNKSDEALAEVAKRVVSVDWAGDVHAELEGNVVDADDLIAKLRAASGTQD